MVKEETSQHDSDSEHPSPAEVIQEIASPKAENIQALKHETLPELKDEIVTNLNNQDRNLNNEVPNQTIPEESKEPRPANDQTHPLSVAPSQLPAPVSDSVEITRT